MKRKMSSLLALVLVFALLASFAGCSKEVDPKEEFENGLKATFAAFGEIGSQFGYDEIAKMTMTAPVHQEMELYLQKASIGMDLSAFYGTGLNMTADSSIPDRKMDLDMGLRIADYDALNMGLTWLEDGIYLTCAELLGDEILGFSMEDLAAESGVDPAMLDPYGMVEKYMDENGKFTLAVGTLTALKDAWTAMADASTWENPEKKAAITAGSDSGEADFYTMTIPAESFIAFAKAAADALLRDDYIAAIMQSAMAYELEGYESYDAMVDEMITELETGMTGAVTQPIVIEYGVMDKLLRQIKTSFTVEEETMDISLTFGMGKNVADYAELLVEVAGGAICLRSQGSHVLADGKFTDNTSFSVEIPEEGTPVEMNMITEYDTKEGGYSWSLDADMDGELMSMASEGSLVIDGKNLNMDIASFGVDAAGMSVELAGAYRISESQNVLMDVSGAKMLPDMTEDEIHELEVLLDENAYILLMNIGQNVPAVGQLIGF